MQHLRRTEFSIGTGLVEPLLWLASATLIGCYLFVRAEAESHRSADLRSYASARRADVARVYPSKDALNVRFKTAGGGHTPTRYIELPSDFRVIIDGKPVGIRDLEVAQELTAHVKVREPVMALAEERPTMALIFVPVRYQAPAEVERTAAVMPQTGSNLPLLLWMGGILGLAASIVRITRLRTGR